MRGMFRPMRLACMLAAALLAACAHYPRADSVRAGETPAEVRGRLGEPAAERRLASGGTAWYYLTGPAGFETWRVVFGPEGKVAEYAQVLNADSFEWMRSGSVTRDQVLDRVGPPGQTMAFARTGTEAWTYRWRFGTLQMIGEPVFDAAAGTVRYVGIFLDPAYNSTVSSQR
jgi:outer membrane protein assembly factor BamE (lipoprotein component of BamABCDE complex)